MITGRTPTAASRALRDVLQRAVSCVTTGVLAGDPLRLSNELQLISRLGRPTGRGHVTLRIEHRYALVHDTAGNARAAWQAPTLGYLYTLEDADGREIVANHWHPTGRSHVTEPHLHLGAGAGALRAELMKAHFMTGMMTPVALLSLMIEQFGVRPRRADWSAVLARAQAALAMP